MTIKSLLLGSAAALAAVSGAQAADAIVAAEPEPVEYVRVCDAFGTGFFYIPGTETCLKISGSVRARVTWDEANDDTTLEYATDVRTRLVFEAKNDSELGTIGSKFRFGATSTNGGGSDVALDYAHITVGGFKIGYTFTFWDDFGIVGEGDTIGKSGGQWDMVSYTYDAGAFTAGIGLDHLTADSSYLTGYDEEYGVGVEAMVSATFDPVTATLYGVYDIVAEEGAIGAVVSAEVGPGTLEALAGYATGTSAYAEYEGWTVGAGYELAATDALTITPSVNYGVVEATDLYILTGGLAVNYALADGLDAGIEATYTTYEDDWAGDDDKSVALYLTRSF